MADGGGEDDGRVDEEKKRFSPWEGTAGSESKSSLKMGLKSVVSLKRKSPDGRRQGGIGAYSDHFDKGNQKRQGRDPLKIREICAQWGKPGVLGRGRVPVVRFLRRILGVPSPFNIIHLALGGVT